MSGRLRDPRVGRDILVGTAAGICVAIIGCVVVLAPSMLGYPPAVPRGFNTESLLSTRQAISVLLRMPPQALLNGMLTTLAFALIRMAVKRTWIATLLTIVLGTFVSVSQPGAQQLWLNIVYAVAVSAVYIAVLVNFGMLPLMMTFLTNYIASNIGLTADVSKLYAPTAIWLMALVIAMAAFGYYASRAGEPLFGKLAET